MNEENKRELNGDELRRASLEADDLGIDWARQRVMINERIDAKRVRGRSVRVAWAGAAAAAVVAVLAIVIWWRSPVMNGGYDADQFFTEIDVISEEYVPEGLYVLNGFLNERPDAEAMVEFIVPQDDSQEEL